jgi:UDP-GlcNAc:undecaprenyl-phosphate GlcNAc-1-phosphate transferase
MNLWESFLNKVNNPILRENLLDISVTLLIAFAISFLITPLVAKIASKVGAVDLPSTLRGKRDKTSSRRIHTVSKPKFGGVSMFISIILVLFLKDYIPQLPSGVILGALIIFVVGLLDDIFEIDSKWSLLGQVLAAFAVVLSGNTILAIDFRLFQLDFNMYSDLVFNFAGITYNFIFPADLITILWIVGLINVVNWTDGADGVTGGITSVAAVVLLLIVLLNGDIFLASVIAIFLGSVLGVLPFNYNPSKIFYASSGAFLAGYYLAVFAIFAGARWTASITILGLFIVDAIFVIILRLRDHPEARRNPLKLLSISDKNHLHHRLLAAGYSHKVVMLIEVSIMLLLGTIAFIFTGIEEEYLALFAGGTFIVVAFTIIAFIRKRSAKQKTIRRLLKDREELKKDVVVNVITDPNEDDEDEYEKFVY